MSTKGCQFALSAMRSAVNSSLFGTLVSFALLALVLVPWQPVMPTNSLDPSWWSVIEWAFIESKDFGKDIIFTFGPLGFLYKAQYHPALYPLQLAFWGAVALFLAAGIGRHWATTPGWVSALLAFSLVVAAGYDRDQWLLALPLLAAVRAIDARDWREHSVTLGLVLVTVFAGLVKFTVFLAAITVFVVADLARALKERSLPVMVPSLVAGSWAAFGMVNGGWDWPQYVLASIELAGGYSAAMQVSGPPIEIVTSIGLGLAVVATAYLTPARANRGARVERSAIAAVFAIVAFLLFKAGVVRHDGHILTTAGGLIVLAAIAAWRAIDQRASWWIQGAAVLTVAMAAYNLLEIPGRHGMGPPPSQVAENLTGQRLRDATSAAYSTVFGDAESRFRISWAEAKWAIRARNPLPALDGTVDVYNWDQADVLAHELHYTPRPVFQSYSAYTPGLIERNADHLLGNVAPDYVLFAPETIDNRLPALEDGMSWPLLWSRYDPIDLTGRHLLLARRRGADRPVVWGEPQVASIRWGEPLSLEPMANTGCVWAELRIESTFAGRLLTAAFKAPMVEVELELANGSKTKRRIIPGMSETGFLLSPHVSDLGGFVGACDVTTRVSGGTVRSATFYRAERAAPFFNDAIQVTIRTVKVAGMRDAVANSALRWLDLGNSIVSGRTEGCEYPVRWQEQKVFAPAPCQVVIERPPRGEFVISFGVFEGAWRSGQTNGVRFEVQTKRDGQWRRLVERELRPREVERDRLGGNFEISIDDEVDAVKLTTDTLGDPNWDWSYWGPIIPREMP